MSKKTGRKPIDSTLTANRTKIVLTVENETLQQLTAIANSRGWVLAEYIRDILRANVRANSKN